MSRQQFSDGANTDDPYAYPSGIRSGDIVVEFFVNSTGNVCGGRFRKLEPGELTMYQMLQRTTERPPPPEIVWPNPRSYGIALLSWPVDKDGRALSVMEARQLAAHDMEAAA